MSFVEKYGPWALITGASSGIGAGFARHLASLKLNVVLVARREDRLRKLASELRESFNIKTKYIVSDLSTESGIESVRTRTQYLDIGLLVNNAGIEQHGSFLRLGEQSSNKVISLNVVAVTSLAHIIGERLVKAGRTGGVIFVSSAMKSGMPWFSAYAASKAYVSMLAISLREEWKDAGIDVFSLEPGLVESDMLTQPDLLCFQLPSVTVEQCVEEAIEAFGEKGMFRTTPGHENDEAIDDTVDKQFTAVTRMMKSIWSADTFEHLPCQ